LSNRSGQVRNVALRSLADLLGPEQLRPLAERALLDESATARWQARMLRIPLGAFDLAEFYRQALAKASTNGRRRAALLGLGESGKREDIPLVREHLLAAPISVRRAALRALGGLEASTTVQPFLVALSDTQPGLSKEGRRALATRVDHVPLALLAAMVRSPELPAHARRNAASLAGQLSKWDALPLLLEASRTAEPEVASRGLALLRGWLSRYNRSFLVPTHAQLDRADEVLDRIAGQMVADQPLEIQDIVRQARRFAKG
jgi:HEAT repeat protein